MAILNKIGYSYNDLTIVPARISNISSRSECYPFLNDEHDLPLFTAPMSSVVNLKNLDIWRYNKITPILPRTINLELRLSGLINGYWIAMSLNEFRTYFIDGGIDLYNPSKRMIQVNMNGNQDEIPVYKVCIDIANGHMESLYTMVNDAKIIAKDKNYTLVIMTGNIANPETYSWLYGKGVDYVRLSIGSGNGCLTSSNTAVHYPIATLIDECNSIRTYGDYETIDNYYPKIIADGGIRNYSDIIKALALGADYVMVGSLFSGFLESAADIYIDEHGTGNYRNAFREILGYFEEGQFIYSYDDGSEIAKRKILSINEGKLYKRFYGMSTKIAQKEIAKANKLENFKMKTSEGVEKMIPCKYTIAQWTDNLIDYMRSAMSYAGAKTLKQFKLNTKLIVNSANEINSVNK
jgi:IMP dehydrogenase/GMP reductase